MTQIENYYGDQNICLVAWWWSNTILVIGPFALIERFFSDHSEFRLCEISVFLRWAHTSVTSANLVFLSSNIPRHNYIIDYGIKRDLIFSWLILNDMKGFMSTNWIIES